MDSHSYTTKHIRATHTIAGRPPSERQRSLVEAPPLRALVYLLIVLTAPLFIGLVEANAQEVMAQEVYAQEVIDPDREATVKAVFLYSYGRYVTWPENVLGKIDGDFVIGVLGDSPVIHKLQRIAAKRTIAGHAIRLIRVESPEKIPRCHILFVAGYSDANRQRAIVEATAGRPVLIVGETHGFAERGAAINFYVSGSNVRFQINSEAVRKRGLQLNAQLLNLGDRVGGAKEN